jgi:hypothetical protein
MLVLATTGGDTLVDFSLLKLLKPAYNDSFVMVRPLRLNTVVPCRGHTHGSRSVPHHNSHPFLGGGEGGGGAGEELCTIIFGQCVIRQHEEVQVLRLDLGSLDFLAK